jgi:MoaA/NifB/PqqE/SkfB family radical SAM enzyme
MLDEGASIFTIEGGDPFLDYNRLRQVCTAIDSRAECWINTTGDGAEKQHIAELVSLGVAGLKISLHGRNEQEHNRFLGGRQGWDKMLSVISYCKEYGLTITFNSRIEPEGFFNGYFDEMMELGANLGALYIQFITPRTAGGNFKGETISYSTRQLEDIGGLINKYNNNREYVGYPGIFFDELDERCVFGCTAGNARFYINAAGDVQPCQHLNMSYGNIKDEPCRQIVKRMQEDFGCRSFTAHCTQIPTLIREQAGSNPVFPLDVSKLDREKLKKILKSDSKAAVNEK